MKVMTKKLARKWVKALRSGEYRQGRERLNYGNQHGTFYCCLGVAEEVCDVPRSPAGVLLDDGVIPLQIQRGGWEHEAQRILSSMNDGGASFEEIANFIERKIIPRLPEKQPESP